MRNSSFKFDLTTAASGHKSNYNSTMNDHESIKPNNLDGGGIERKYSKMAIVALKKGRQVKRNYSNTHNHNNEDIKEDGRNRKGGNRN